MPPSVKNPHFLTTSSKKLLHSSIICPLRLIPSGQPTLIVFRDGNLYPRSIVPFIPEFPHKSAKKCSFRAKKTPKTHFLTTSIF